MASVTLTWLATNQALYVSLASVTSDQPDPRLASRTAFASLEVDPPPLVTISDAAVREGNFGSSSVAFTLSLSSAVSVPVTVRYQTADGTALAGVDYNTNAGLVTIPAGSLTGVLGLNSAIIGNTLVQSNRFFFVNLLTTNATLLRTQAVATIVEDDFRTITISNIALLEGDQGITNALFSCILTPAASTPVTFDYQTVDGSATAGSDYAAHVGTQFFAPGVTNLTLAIPVYGDTLPEMNETFSLLLSQPSGAVLGVDTVQATIINDDPLPPLEFASATFEGQVLHLRFPTIEGRSYRVDQTAALGQLAWFVLGNNIPGTGLIVDVADPKAAQRSQSFYRLVLLP